MTLGQKLILTAVISGALVGPVFGGVKLLENAYWTFEEGVAGERVAASGSDPADPESPNSPAGTVVDVTGNGNNMRRYGIDNAPIYTSDVPGPVVPATGVANTVALGFDGTFRDLYTDGKDINNPEVTAFTLEASFKVAVLLGSDDQAIVSKDSKAAWGDEGNCGNPNNDCTHDEPPLSLKITASGALLMIQVRDAANALTQVVSLEPIQPSQWYHAAVVATNTELKLYLNSLDGEGYVLQGTAPITGSGPLWMGGLKTDGTIAGYDTRWNIGKGMSARVFAHAFAQGSIDEVRLSNVALEPTDFLWYELDLPGDFNSDTHVTAADLDIFIVFARLKGVVYVQLAEVCPLALVDNKLAADLDNDNDIDLTDFGIFQTLYTLE